MTILLWLFLYHTESFCFYVTEPEEERNIECKTVKF